MHDPERVAAMLPKPATEIHQEFGTHESIWLIASCGHPSHPYYWSCSVCAREPKSEGRDL